MKLSSLIESPYYAPWCSEITAVIADGVDVTELGVTFIDQEKGEYLHYYKPGDEDKFVATAPDGTPMERLSRAVKIEIIYPHELQELVEDWKYEQQSRETRLEQGIQD